MEKPKFSDDEKAGFMREFQERLKDIASRNPNLQPNSPELLALVKEFNDKGIPITMISLDKKELMKRFSDMQEQLMKALEPINEGDMFSDNSDVAVMEDPNEPKNKIQKRGYDTIDNRAEISKKEVDDLVIDFETMSDEKIWEKYFGGVK